MCVCVCVCVCVLLRWSRQPPTRIVLIGCSRSASSTRLYPTQAKRQPAAAQANTNTRHTRRMWMIVSVRVFRALLVSDNGFGMEESTFHRWVGSRNHHTQTDRQTDRHTDTPIHTQTRQPRHLSLHPPLSLYVSGFCTTGATHRTPLARATSTAWASRWPSPASPGTASSSPNPNTP